jgi:hypothetical protein
MLRSNHAAIGVTLNVANLVIVVYQGRFQDFKLGGGAPLKKLRRAEGGAKFVWVFLVKNHDFTPKNHIFSNFRGGRAGCAPLDPPLYTYP